jgi:hypothetical protein
MKLRRFVEGVPWAFVKPALDYLLSLSPYSGVIANGVDFGVAYRPTLTLWQRDAQSAALGGRGDATYTLIQDLVETSSDDLYTVGTSSSCTETVETEYVWDATGVEDIPQGSVGVTYQVAAVHRNEDGTFNYALVKRVALTQHLPESVTEDNAVRRVSVETWDNVYPGPGGGYLDETGDALAVPSPGATAGVEVKQPQISVNPDCTVKIQVVREVSKTAKIRESTAKTIFESNREEGLSGQKKPLPEAPPAGDGCVKTHESQLQPDGSYATTEKAMQEIAVDDAEVEVTRGRRGTRTSKTHRNKTSAPSTSELPVGRTVKYRKTPGGRYDITESNLDVRVSSTVGSGCHRDRFKHIDTTLKASTDATVDHVSGGSDGKIVSKDATMDDEGFVTVTTKTEQERTVTGAEVAHQVTLDGCVKITKDHSTASRPSPLVFSRDAIGKSTQSVVTPGGRYTNETRTPARGGATVTVESATSAKSTDVRTTVTTTSESDQAISDATSSVTSGQGVYREKTVRVNSLGGLTQSVVSITEARGKVTGEQYRVTPRGVVKTVTSQSASQTPKSSFTRGKPVDNQLTPGGLYTVTESAPVVVLPAGQFHSAADAHMEEVDVVSTAIATSPDKAPAAFNANGTYVTKDSTVDEYGFVQTVERRVTERQVTSRYGSEDDIFHKATTTLTRSSEPLAASEGPSQRVPGQGGSITKRSSQLTRGGLWDNEQTVDIPKFVSWSDDFESDLYVVYIFYYRNASTSQRDQVKNAALSKWDSLRAKYTSGQWGAGPKAPTSARITPSSSLNQYGLYDGYYTLELSWSPESGGRDVNHESGEFILASWSYKVVSNSFSVGIRSSADDESPSVNIHRTVQTKYVTEDLVRGWKTYVQNKFGTGNLLYEGSRVSVTPSTGVAHGVRVTDAVTKITVSNVQSLTPFKWGED